MKRETQKEVLKLHFEQCYNFYQREGYSDVCSYANSLIDIVRTNYNPFAPRGEKFNADVRREIVEILLDEFCDVVRKELEKNINNNN